MTAITVAPPNGTKPEPQSKSWLQSSVQAFFTGFNWEDQSAEVQELKLQGLQGTNTPLSLTLSVNQFFGAINWEGVAAAAPVAVLAPTSQPVSVANDLTLDDFSSLF
ncbi:hypothetical protein H6F90_09275 [Trichocoleus sp. FACHB-591]|uniref:hypothetical protein n=1 Tax=Trichocoleus sp. FACHB-591 TaxID=2692872 RepID=UPI001689D7A1|nr:hypothetical protein [Trichocoleus sp. FACHB-591]MBD2095347.1 hypothetical protein [Trichocoleus sp. FACHB-591]